MGFSLKNIFHAVGATLKVAEEKIGQFLGFLDTHAAQVQQVATEAVEVIQGIQNVLGPNRDLAAVEGMVDKALLHMPPADATPLEVDAFLQNLAVVELQKSFPSFSQTVLRSGIQIAYGTMQAAAKSAPEAPVAQ